MPKENLVIVHSFPTNSILLRGLIDYLDDYLEVYFVDLPGFTKAIPAIPEINLDGYAKFVEQKVAEFALDSYWLGGVSFGFFVVNHIRFDPKCRGIIALEPYIGSASLQIGFLKSAFYRLICKSVLALNLASFLWTNRLGQKYIARLGNYPPEAINILFDQIAAKTFFQTASLILSDQKSPHFQPLPYLLIAHQ